jgi:hypothetical protein
MPLVQEGQLAPADNRLRSQYQPSTSQINGKWNNVK